MQRVLLVAEVSETKSAARRASRQGGIGSLRFVLTFVINESNSVDS